MTTRVLAVDDNHEQLATLRSVLELHGFEVSTAADGVQAMERMAADPPEIVLLDVNMPRMTSLEVAARAKKDETLRYIPIILLTANDELDDLLKGFDAGADDYIKKPFDPKELVARVKAMARMRAVYRELQRSTALNVALSRENSERGAFNDIIGTSSSLKDVLDLVRKVAPSNIPVLICGESGTGKELIARAVHRQGDRSARPFVVQNCSAFNDNLLESELFGHLRGSFTGAVRDKVGLFEVADGGTFFLDEIGDMSPALQVKLLRVLQDGSFTPIGGTRSKQVDVRLVAATNRDLEKMVREGSFREDLLYRLNAITITMPPLRDRAQDIPILAEYFLQGIAKRGRRTPKSLNTDAKTGLMSYAWPGNIRQLQNEIERAVLLSGADPEISLGAFSKVIVDCAAGSIDNGLAQSASEPTLKAATETLERRMLEAALKESGGNKSEAARTLGISRSSLIAKVNEYFPEKGREE